MKEVSEMSDVQQLVPFKVELIPFAELPIDWSHGERELSGDFLRRLTRDGRFFDKVEELKKKMVENPFKQAFEEVYSRTIASWGAGEWIVVGKIGFWYLAVQPKRVAQMLPMECCRFVGLL